MSNLTKTQFIAALAEEAKLDKASIEATLAALNTVIMREVAAGNAVTLPNLLKVACRDRPAGTFRNPATGEQVHKEASRKVAVTILKGLKEAI